MAAMDQPTPSFHSIGATNDASDEIDVIADTELEELPLFH